MTFMARNALACSLIIYAALAALVLRECWFLAPLWRPIWTEYGTWLVIFSTALVLNLFAMAYGLLRKLALKDTGDKLAHLEKQLRGSTTISDELTEQIREHRK